jgi:hypothetical protein
MSDKQLTPRLHQEGLAQDEYKQSLRRVAEGVAINVVSACMISTIAALMLAIPSSLILFLQHFFHFLIVSTNALEISAIVGITTFLMLFTIILVSYLVFRNKPYTIMLSILGFTLGAYLDARKATVDLTSMDAWLHNHR